MSHLGLGHWENLLRVKRNFFLSKSMLAEISILDQGRICKYFWFSQDAEANGDWLYPQRNS